MEKRGRGVLGSICFFLTVAFCLFLNGMAAEAYNYVVNPSNVSPVTNDLWDIAKGNKVTGFSDSYNEKPEIEEMFGKTGVLPESGIALFSDSYVENYKHWVTWRTPTPIVLTSFNLFAAHDSISDNRNITYRGFRTFNLYAFLNNNWKNIFEYQHPQNENTYGGGTGKNELILQVTGLNVIGQEFKAEFIEAGENGNVAGAKGPRIIELDGFGYPVPLPSAILLLLPGFVGIIGLRKVLK